MIAAKAPSRGSDGNGCGSTKVRVRPKGALVLFTQGRGEPARMVLGSPAARGPTVDDGRGYARGTAAGEAP